MQQYFVKGPLSLHEDLLLEEEQRHHILHVMRMRPGDLVRVADDSGCVMLAKLRMQEGSVWALPIEIVDRALEKAKITLIMGLIKGERWEWVIQKAAELGATRIVPLQSRYCVVKLPKEKLDKKLTRWRTIAKEASEQCKRSTILKVEAPITMQMLDRVRSSVNLIAYERCDATSQSLAQVLRPQAPTSISVMIGCEGGFSEEEALQARALGFSWVSLGTRILRAETAAMSVLANISYEWESRDAE